MITSVSLLAVVSAQTYFWLELGCAAVVLLFAIIQYNATRALSVITHNSEEGRWQLNLPGKQEINGQLIGAGYRSAFLIILVIQHEGSRTHSRFPNWFQKRSKFKDQYQRVWHDQVSDSDFSYLHYQMLFNASQEHGEKPNSLRQGSENG